MASPSTLWVRGRRPRLPAPHSPVFSTGASPSWRRLHPSPLTWRLPRSLSLSTHASPFGSVASPLPLSAAAGHVTTTTTPARFFSQTPAALLSPSPPSAVAEGLGDRFRCPECGKRFLCAANLLHHRTSRHGLHVTTPADEAHAALEADNAVLQAKLAAVRAQVAALKAAAAQRGSKSTSSGHAADPSSSSPSPSSPVAFSKTYPSAVQTGQLLEAEADVWREWRRSGHALGTGISHVSCVGTVAGAVQLGTLAGWGAAAKEAPRVLQFTVEVHGYRERRPGQLKMYRAQLPVRYLVDSGADPRPLPLFVVREGDVVRVQGHYAFHNSYDMVSKQPVENVVVEADAVGLLHRPEPLAVTESSNDQGLGGRAGRENGTAAVEAAPAVSAPAAKPDSLQPSVAPTRKSDAPPTATANAEFSAATLPSHGASTSANTQRKGKVKRAKKKKVTRK